MTPERGRRPRAIRVTEAMQLLGCSDKTVYRMIHQRRLEAFRLSRRGGWRIWEASVERLIRERERDDDQ